MIVRKRNLRRRSSGITAVNQEEIMKNLKSEDETLQLWAIDQIPPVGQIGAAKVAASAFEYINAVILSKEDEFQEAVQHAILRELKYNVLKPEDRIRVLLPFLLKMSRSTPYKIWNDLLRQVCRGIRDPIHQSLAFDQLTPIFLLDRSSNGTQCAIHMLMGLCEAGATMPVDLINTVLQQPVVLQQFLPQFLSCIISTQSDAFIRQTLDTIIHSPISQSALFTAAISLPFIPDVLLKQIKTILQAPAHTQDVATAIAKNHQIILEKGWCKPKTLLQIVWKAKIFTPQNYDIIADFFADFIEFMSVKDTVLFCKKIVQSKSPKSNDIVQLVMNNSVSRETTSFVIPYLCSDESFALFESWNQAVSNIIHLVNSDDATKLTENIIDRCRAEIEIGHVSKLKVDQEVVRQLHLKPTKVVRVKGYKEISMMLNTLAASPCISLILSEGIPLMKKALTIHTYPLASSIAAVLRRISTHPNEVCNFLEELRTKNSTSQIMFMKILPDIVFGFDMKLLTNKLLPMYFSMFSTEVPSNVYCVAIKTLGVITKIGFNITKTKVYTDVMEIIKTIRQSEDEAVQDAVKAAKRDIDAIIKLPEQQEKASRRSSLQNKKPQLKENVDPNITVPVKRNSLLGNKSVKGTMGVVIKPEKAPSSRKRRSSIKEIVI